MSRPAFEGVPRVPEIADRDFDRFRALIERTTGIHLGERKRDLVCARLGPRLRELRLPGFADYWRYLEEEDPGGEELRRLVNRITTNKTSFFREAHHFTLLSERVLRPFAEGLGHGGPRRLRLWSAGCSTGEEPWSIAMTIAAEVPSWASADVRLLATDIDSEVLATGESGTYPDERASAIPPAVLRAGFLRGRGSFAGRLQVRPQLRKLVVFRELNLIAEPWPLRAAFDAIFCRNVLIYFTPLQQRRLIERLLERLRPGGLLLLGHAESLLGMRPGLRALGRTAFEKVAGEGQ